ncbi:azurin [Roseimicrobium gellanilyticum]|uniref:Azurin n=1 Tax=Roseimicrobium gellanilyticum TaxID=748857 RepID=A0A366HK95_9BACT|nr:DUF6797 domain-containing protein [Roseimicrobium gellanilyticum]RBP42664.1 azurin [Roseimicrobium gellanilyticum]
MSLFLPLRFRAPVLTLILAVAASAQSGTPDIYRRENLAAWCIVPFDAKQRGPEERAAMLEKLGLRQFIYDYRKEHIPTFDAEMEALKKHGITLTGWWFPTSMNDDAKLILEVLKRHGMTKCDLWVTGGGAATNSPEEQAARVKQEAARLKPIAEAAAKIGVRVGLYNHGSWFGEPENQIAIIEALKAQGISNVGIVYNLHHGHGHLTRFPELLQKMKPHLVCLNLNGMTVDGDKKGQKILPLGQGDLDLKLIKDIRDSGYSGPIGILNHTGADAEARLMDNLDGLAWLVKQLDGKAPGPKPKTRTWPELTPKAASPKTTASSMPSFVPSKSEALGTAVKGGIVFPGKADYQNFPITVECLAKLDGKSGFNILLANGPKSSPQHWELYTYSGSGFVSVFMPKRGGEYKSKLNVCDGEWHRISAILEKDRVRITVDKKVVLDEPVKEVAADAPPESFAVGRLVEGGLGCDVIIDEVRISRGNSNPVGRGEPLVISDSTLALWHFDDKEATLKEASGGAGAVSAALFEYRKEPLQPELWPNHKEHVNRDRIYDFYAKEALQFKGADKLPAVTPPYPGLDGGTLGHWGNQSDDTWRDARWSQSDLGDLLSGVFKGAGLTIPKAVCVRLGDKGEMSACFDPETLSFPVVWQGGFISLSDVRHGFMAGLKMDGTVATKEAGVKPKEPFKYHGFYRNGKKTIFAYQLGGVEMLDAAWVENGKFVRLKAPASGHPWRDLIKGGTAQWPQVITTKGEVGKDASFALDTLTLPEDNPFGTLFFIGDHDFFSNGDGAVCTMTGEVWIVKGIDDKLANLKWKRFATGLHQPQGLLIVEDKIHVLGRDQITRLVDLNGDDEADQYECVTNAMITSPSGHDYITGLQRDTEGRFYFASGNEGVCRVKPGSAVEVLATGFRNPNGLGLSKSGIITTSVQEGDWTPTSAVSEIKTGSYYGFGGPKPGVTTEQPVIYLPRGVDNSSGGQAFVEGTRFGLPEETMLHFSCGACTGFAVLRDTSAGIPQGLAWQLPADFLSGAQRGRFHPKDGQLYVSGMYGWGCYGPKDGHLQRVRFTGDKSTPQSNFPVKWEARQNGVMVTFNQPLDKATAANVKQHFVQAWNYLYSGAYGSQEWSVKHPKVAGHDVLEITSTRVMPDGKTVFLEVPELPVANQVHLHIATAKDETHDLFATIHRLGKPFTDFPNAKPLLAKATTAAPPTDAGFAFPPAKPNPWAEGEKGRAVQLDAALGLQFAQKTLTVKVGERISLTLNNPDVVPHNVVLIKPGKLQAIGDLSNKLITDPEGPAKHYVPESGDVIAYTDMVMPQKQFTIHLTAPMEKGEYLYLCTFPGHWVVMNGVLKVE